jgi:serine/threonine-protein kinase
MMRANGVRPLHPGNTLHGSAPFNRDTQTQTQTQTQSQTLRSEKEVVDRLPMVMAPFPRALDQHLVSERIAAGGMASVHLAVSADERQPVLALKRVHPHLASDEHFTQMLLDEAAISSCVRHENVVRTYGADMIGDEIFLVMEYVPGLPLHIIMQKTSRGPIPVRFATAIIADALRGLHAAHEAVDENGDSLAIVHRDVSPQNILLGLDGIARVIDFGVAKATRRSRDTRAGELRGKLAYMTPEHLSGEAVDRRADIYAAAVVLWEALVGAPLFYSSTDGGTLRKVIGGCSTRPGRRASGVPAALDAVVMRGLAMRPEDRFATALDMARALDSVFAANPVRPNELSAWLRELGADIIRKQARVPAELRGRSRPPSVPALQLVAPPAPPPAPPPAAPPPFASSVQARILATVSPQHQKVAILAGLFVAGLAWGILFAVAFATVMNVARSIASSTESRASSGKTVS